MGSKLLIKLLIQQKMLEIVQIYPKKSFGVVRNYVKFLWKLQKISALMG